MDDNLVISALFFGHFRNDGGFEVFFICESLECLCIFFRSDDCHTLLRFGDGQFCAVQAFVFLRYFVQIDMQAICQLTDCNGYTAGSEVIAPLDQTGCTRITEQSLQLALFRGISLLHFCTASFQ